MSKNKNNVHPDHYKVAGRERQGENVVHQIEKRRSDQVNSAKGESEGQSPSDKKERHDRAGISNRESPAEEARERREHPPVDTSSPPPEDAAGRTGEQPLEDRRDRHTSHKAGSRSIAQKESESRYPDRSMPASRKVAGAFGREPKGE